MFTTLTQKVVAGMVVVWLLLVFLTLNAFLTLQQNRDSLAYISDHTIVLTRARNDFVLSMYQAIQNTRQYIMNGDSESRAAAFTSLEDAEANMRYIIQPLEVDDRSIIGLEPISQDQITDRTEILIEVRSSVSQVIRNIEQNPQENEAQLVRLQRTEDRLNTYISDTESVIDEEVLAAQSTTVKASQRGMIIIPVTFLALLLCSVILLWAIRRSILNPIRYLSSVTESVTAGDLSLRLPENRIDEIGSLQRSFNTMVSDLQQQQSELKLRATELETTLSEQQMLFSTIKELSTPLLPVTKGVVVLPIVGHVDAVRADELTEALLAGVAERRARIVILDVTGIPLMQADVIQLLMRAAYATQLLGARVWFAGISPLLAQSLADQDIELEDLRTFRDLSAATAEAFRILGR